MFELVASSKTSCFGFSIFRQDLLRFVVLSKCTKYVATRLADADNVTCYSMVDFATSSECIICDQLVTRCELPSHCKRSAIGDDKSISTTIIQDNRP